MFLSQQTDIESNTSSLPNNSSPSSYPNDIEPKQPVSTGVTHPLNSSQVMSSANNNSTNSVCTNNGSISGTSIPNSCLEVQQQQQIVNSNLGVNISESVISGASTSCSTSMSPQDSLPREGQVMNQSVNGNSVGLPQSQGNSAANSSSSQSVSSGASSSNSNVQPKRLHVSNIPFRFRDVDLRKLFGVSINLFAQMNNCSALSRVCQIPVFQTVFS